MGQHHTTAKRSVTEYPSRGGDTSLGDPYTTQNPLPLRRGVWVDSVQPHPPSSEVCYKYRNDTRQDQVELRLTIATKMAALAMTLAMGERPLYIDT